MAAEVVVRRIKGGPVIVAVVGMIAGEIVLAVMAALVMTERRSELQLDSRVTAMPDAIRWTVLVLATDSFADVSYLSVLLSSGFLKITVTPSITGRAALSTGRPFPRF